MKLPGLDDAEAGLKMWQAYFEWVEKNWLKWPEDKNKWPEEEK